MRPSPVAEPYGLHVSPFHSRVIASRPVGVAIRNPNRNGNGGGLEAV